MVEANNLLRLLLRVITLEEIGEMTTMTRGGNSRPLTEYIDKYLISESVVEGKILKFAPPFSNETKKVLGPIVVKNADEKKSTPAFILEEQRKIKDKQKKLKAKEVLELYDEESSVSIEQEKKLKNSAQSSHAGILVNKKQA